LTPSPTIAHSACLEAPNRGGLVGRPNLGRDLVDADPSSDGVGDRLRVAGEHRHAQPHPMQARNRVDRLGTHLVLGRERADEPAVRDHVEHRPSLRGPRVALVPDTAAQLDAGIRQDSWTAHLHFTTLDGRPSADAGARLETARHRHQDFALRRQPANSSGQRML